MSRKRMFTLLALVSMTSLSQAQWVSRNNGLPTTGYPSFVEALSATVAITNTITTQGDMYRTRDAGMHWENIACPPGEGAMTLSTIDSLHIWIAASSARIFYTSDGGKTWVKQFVDSSRTQFLNYIKMFDAQNGLAMGDAMSASLPPIFLRTTDGGAHWVSVNDSAIGGYSGDQWNRLSFMNPDTGYFYSSGGALSGLYKTFDGCRTWRKVNYPSGSGCIEFANEHVGLVAPLDLTASVWRTTDGGDTWTQYTRIGSPNVTDIEFMKHDISKVWMLTLSELLVSVDTGRTWTVIMNLPQYCYDINFPDSTHGWLVGRNTVLYSENPFVISGLEERTISVPAGFTLEQNYPNPFNQSTTIRYALPENSRVKLEIFNLLGERVAELVNAEESAGYKQVVWNAQVPSGIYIYRIEAYSSTGLTNRYTESRKMLILK